MANDDVILKLSSLTTRQIEVLRLVCEGLSYREVGEQLFLAENTIKSHMGRIYIKLKLNMLSESERKKVLHQEFCIALQELEIIPKSIEEQEEIEPDPVPESVLAMVVRDETDIILMPHREIIDVKPFPKRNRSSRLRWLMFGIIIGAILTTLIVYLAWNNDQLNLLKLSPAAPTPQRLISEIQEKQPEEVVLIVTATPEPTKPSTSQAVLETTEVDSAPSQTETMAPTNTPLAPDFTSTPIMNLPYQDTFDLRLNPTWEPMMGAWRVVDGKLTNEPGSGDGQIFIGDEQWSNYTVEVDVFMDDWYTPALIIVRSQDNGYLVFKIHIHGTDLFLYSDGDSMKIAHSDTGVMDIPGGWRYDKIYRIQIDANQDIFTAYINGVKTLQVQDDTLTNGRVALGHGGPQEIWFDNFEINELP
ncbi:LuxR C-terminal-related transcriptional regulator [Chloroflexota bacterium]